MFVIPSEMNWFYNIKAMILKIICKEEEDVTLNRRFFERKSDHFQGILLNYILIFDRVEQRYPIIMIVDNTAITAVDIRNRDIIDLTCFRSASSSKIFL